MKLVDTCFVAAALSHMASAILALYAGKKIQSTSGIQGVRSAIRVSLLLLIYLARIMSVGH